MNNDAHGDDWVELPFASSFGHLVRSIYRLQSQLLQARLAEDGVSIGCWYFLRVLWEEDMITQRELSQRTGLNEATTRTGVDRMEDEDLVVRITDPKDRRKRYIQTTARAKSLEPKLVGFADELNVKVLQPIPKGEQKAFMTNLAAVHAHLEKMAANSKGGSGIDEV